MNERETLSECRCNPRRQPGLPWTAHQPGCPERRPPTWHVTLLARGVELTVEVYSGTKEGARREARKFHPNSHIVHVEEQS